MRSGLEALAVHAFAQQLAVAPDRFSPLPLFARRGFLEASAQLHLTKNALTLQLLFEHAEGLIDVVVANLYQHFGANAPFRSCRRARWRVGRL